MKIEEANKILEEMNVYPEELKGESKRLFEAIMKIADERDSVKADLYEANNRIADLMNIIDERDKIIDLMVEHIYTGCDFDNNIKTREQIKEYFEERCHNG